MGRITRRLAVLGAAVTTLLGGAGASLTDEDPSLTEFGVVFTPSGVSLSKSSNRIQITKPDFDVVLRYYRLRFHVTNPDAAPWTMTIRSPAGQVLSTFDQTDERCETADGCWTVRLNAGVLTLRFDTPSENTQAQALSGLYMPEKAKKTFYSRVQGSEAEDIASLDLGDDDEKSLIQDKAENLGMFIGSGPTADGGGKANWCCSGVRLSRDLFMTNWHCGAAEGLPDSAFWNTSAAFNSCQASLVDMSWDHDLQGREYSCRKVEFKNKDLDVAILRLGRLADGPPLARPLTLPVLSGHRAAAGHQIALLHHPECKPKSITRNCSIKDPMVPSWTDGQEKSEFSHSCSTENGSSGGPVYASDGALIGLHHLGKKPGQTEPANYAVSTEAILAAIKQSNAALFEEITGTAP